MVMTLPEGIWHSLYVWVTSWVMWKVMRFVASRKTWFKLCTKAWNIKYSMEYLIVSMATQAKRLWLEVRAVEHFLCTQKSLAQLRIPGICFSGT
jgi:hypothetical protein